MSTPQTPDTMLEQMWGPPPSASDAWKHIPPWVKWVAFLLLLYLIGPVIVYAKGTQEYAAGPSWQAEKRWAQVNGSVFLWLLFYIPIVFFHASLASFWTSMFVTFAHWFHLPFLAWLGGTTLLPPVPSSTILRWVLAFPLAGLIAICIEAVQPQTTWQSKRIITQEEQQELDAVAAAEEKKKLAQEKRKLKATQQAQTNTSTTADGTPAPAPPKKPRKPRTPAKPKGEKQPLLPPPNSLWGQIDWRTVPDDHPLKQAVREEAERLEAQRREEDRNRWLAQQRVAQNISPQTIDSTLASSTPTPAPVPAETAKTADNDGYNWDEGEGSIQE